MLRGFYVGVLCCTLVVLASGAKPKSKFRKRCNDDYFDGDMSRVFHCETGDNMCIPMKNKCDSVIDCEDASDEMDCSNAHEIDCKDSFDGKWINGAALLSFRCDSGMCIEECRRCDQVDDCPDGSDEKEADCSNKDTCDYLNSMEYQCQRKVPYMRSCDEN